MLDTSADAGLHGFLALELEMTDADRGAASDTPNKEAAAKIVLNCIL